MTECDCRPPDFTLEAFDSASKLCAFGDQRRDNVQERFRVFDRGRAIILPMNRAGLVLIWLALLAVPAVAIGVTGSVWAGLIVAALEFGFCGLLRIRRQAR